MVGSATSVTKTAQAWVAPAEIAALRAPGAPDLAQMLYRFSRAATTAEVNADVAALRAALPPGALTGAQSWLTAKPKATGSTAPWSWWQQAACDSYILIGLAALTLVVIKNLPPERWGPGAAGTLAAPHDQERGPVPSGTRDDASVPARPQIQGGGLLLPVPEAARAGTAAAPCAEGHPPGGLTAGDQTGQPGRRRSPARTVKPESMPLTTGAATGDHSWLFWARNPAGRRGRA